ncbi:hypothetical protein K32_07850 [Kaistia sp. 32K]|nr:hypothetical protein K32_07850 [Kaistia sp. 32K]
MDVALAHAAFGGEVGQRAAARAARQRFQHLEAFDDRRFHASLPTSTSANRSVSPDSPPEIPSVLSKGCSAPGAKFQYVKRASI